MRVRFKDFLQKNGFKSTSEISGNKMGEYMGILHSSKAVKNLDFWYFLPSNDINDETIPDIEHEVKTATIINTTPKNQGLVGTIIELPDSRKILLDGTYTSGDTIKLTDGTVVTIK